MPICARCGRENADDARFCSGCGTPLAAEEPPRRMRKTVTVVFADVSGSTALGERLDPESLQQVMSRYFETARGALERHGGTVEKFIGDAVVAVFGIPVLHEDDALRAVRAAAEMRDELTRLNEELERERGVTIAVRTGVNTGEVVAGDPATGQSFATGDAVNVAARLEQAAEPGDVLVGEQTYRLVRDAVVVEELDALALKGKDASVRAYRLRHLLPGVPGHVRRLDSPMVGRERQRALLEQAFENAVSDRACHLFTVLGSAGVGKSRLVQEFLRGLGGRATVLRGRCLPYGEGITYWPLVEAVTQAAGLDETDSAAQAQAKIAALLDGGDETDVIAERIGELVGLTEVPAGAEETFWAVRKLLERLASCRSLVAVFDDIQWAEPTFLDLVEHVAEWSRGAPILLLCMARPELLDARPGWSGGKLNASTVLLEPLTDEECDRLVDNLLGEARLADEARDRIADAAEGNPLFVEEMLAMLIDDGLLERVNGRWAPTADLSAVTVPPTIQALLAARLDRLDGRERAVIERAAIEGKVFHLGAVATLSPEDVRPGIGTSVMSLVRKELIRPDDSTFAGDDAFRFRHQLIRDAAYAGMPKQSRAELHERFAGWLEAVAAERLTEYDEILGYHLEQAHRYRAELGPIDESGGLLAGRAGEHLAAAGRRALARDDPRAAANLLTRAAALLPSGSEHTEILLHLADALAQTGQFGRAAERAREAAEAARAAGDPRLELHGELAVLDTRKNLDPSLETAGLIQEAEQAIDFFEAVGDEHGLARAWTVVAAAHWFACRFEDGGRAFERAAAHAARAGDVRLEANLVSWHGASLWAGPVPVDEAIASCSVFLERVGANRLAALRLTRTIAMLEAMRGRFDDARALAAEVRAVSEELGLGPEIALSDARDGWLAYYAGDLDAAERAFRSACERLEEMGETGWLCSRLGELGFVLCELGRFEEATEAAESAERTAAPDDLEARAFALGVRAWTCAARGDADAADVLSAEAVALLGNSDATDIVGDVWRLRGEALALAGRTGDALKALRASLAKYEAKGHVPAAGRLRERIEAVGTVEA